MNNFLNNYSDIKSLIEEEFIKEIIKNINNKSYIKVTSKLIHKTDKITAYEQFIFNLDNYITFIKEHLFINQLEIRYITLLTLNNKHNKILTNSNYYYSNIDFYINEFIKMFMYNYNKNIKILKRYINIKKLTFDELTSKINKQNKKAFIYFEKINASNLNYYLELIKYLENIN